MIDFGIGTSLAIQWLRLCASTAGSEGSIPGRGTKILHASQNNREKVLSVRGAGEGVEVQA